MRARGPGPGHPLGAIGQSGGRVGQRAGDLDRRPGHRIGRLDPDGEQFPPSDKHLPGHRQGEPGCTTTHEVEVLEHTRLAGVIGAGAHAVNSFHHQAVDKLGEGLKVVARADDGTVEGIEGPGSFTIGVQWHAETLYGQLALFEALVRAAARTELRVAA